MKKVLDASAFFSEVTYRGELYTTWSVVSELKDISSKIRYDLFREEGLEVLDPSEPYLSRAREASVHAGEQEVLSATDIDVLALATQLGASVVTDDYAIQNVARRLGVTVVPILQKKTRGIRWQFRCTGCGKYALGPGDCPVCGAPVKRRIK
jgi:UPF0271 protein